MLPKARKDAKVGEGKGHPWCPAPPCRLFRPTPMDGSGMRHGSMRRRGTAEHGRERKAGKRPRLGTHYLRHSSPSSDCSATLRSRRSLSRLWLLSLLRCLSSLSRGRSLSSRSRLSFLCRLLPLCFFSSSDSESEWCRLLRCLRDLRSLSSLSALALRRLLFRRRRSFLWRRLSSSSSCSPSSASRSSFLACRYAMWAASSSCRTSSESSALYSGSCSNVSFTDSHVLSRVTALDFLSIDRKESFACFLLLSSLAAFSWAFPRSSSKNSFLFPTVTAAASWDAADTAAKNSSRAPSSVTAISPSLTASFRTALSLSYCCSTSSSTSSNSSRGREPDRFASTALYASSSLMSGKNSFHRMRGTIFPSAICARRKSEKVSRLRRSASRRSSFSHSFSSLSLRSRSRMCS
mmetsp:Transcript_14734/g.41480  ORF Transcript_14734/g.41480 Transcript_14734/m.41480 type:complete len:407 (+) Transcript_14734:222-1442(+)